MGGLADRGWRAWESGVVVPDDASDDEAAERGRFAREALRRIQEQGAEGPFTLDEESMRILRPGAGPIVLDELFELSRRASPERREELLARFARITANPPQAPAGYEEAKPRILPLVKPRVLHEILPLLREAGEAGDPVFGGALTDHVTIEMVVSVEEGVTITLGPDLLRRWDVGPAAAMEDAAKNLGARGVPPWKSSAEAPGVLRSPWSDGFDASRVVFPDLFRSLGLAGDPVAVLVKAGMVLVAGADDEDGLFHLGRAARREMEASHAFLVARPLRLASEGWVHWVPGEGHPARPLLRLLEAIGEQTDDQVQARAVSRLRRSKAAEGPRLAPLSILQARLGADVVTSTVWDDGAPQWLPKADFVQFRRGEEWLGAAPWEKVTAALQASMTSRPVYPARWQVDGFPSEWELGSLDLQPLPPA
jgi:hypothetical protein